MTALALTGGHWERRGLTRVWVEDSDATPDEAADMLVGILRGIRSQLNTASITGVPCEDCGCLLRHTTELCPACVIPWCRAQEKVGRRIQVERANRAGWYTRKRVA